MKSYHTPILTKQIVEYVITKLDGTYIDCTIGFGGHSKEILNKLNNKGKVIGIDLDPYALKMAKENLIRKYNNIHFYNDSYLNFPEILNELKIKEVDGFIFDLGISSYQVDSKHRGFSYRYDSPLDMRFNPELIGTTAKDILNKYSEKELSQIIKIYGEERYHKKIARKIIETRKKNKINSTFDLKKIIFSVIPYENNKVLSRVFQSIRIAVNDEINNINKTLEKAIKYLKINGKIAVISFHSIEDRIIKHFFKSIANNSNIDSSEKQQYKIITKKPIIPLIEEIRQNKRSRSAKLRITERIS